jgi:hypothetical protein
MTPHGSWPWRTRQARGGKSVLSPLRSRHSELLVPMQLRLDRPVASSSGLAFAHRVAFLLGV